MSVGQGLPGVGGPFALNGDDLLVNKPFPGATFLGTEPGGVVSDMREINGAFWVVTNAFYNQNGGFQQSNPAITSTALVINATGAVQIASAPVGSPNPIIWTFAAISSSLGPGAALANIGNRGLTAAYLAQAQNLTQLGYYSVVDQGATRNGVSDDSSFILNTHALAGLAAGQTHGAAVVYYPPGIYYYNSPTSIAINPGVGVFATQALIIGGPATTDCFHYVETGGNENEGSFNNSWLAGDDFLPSVKGFLNGWGLRVNSSDRNIHFNSIQFCLRGFGWEVNQAAGVSCIDNNVWGNIIGNCTTGVYNYSDNAGAQYAQGNVIDVNFVVACQYSVHWAQGTGTSSPIFTINVYKLHAIDPAAATATSYVFFQDAIGYSAGNFVQVDSFCAPATTTGAQIFSPRMNTHFHNIYELCLAFAATTLPTVIGTVPIFSRISPLQSSVSSQSIYNSGAYVPASNTSGSRGTGAYPASFQYLQSSLNIMAALIVKAGGLAAGAYQDCWIYCDLLCGTTPVIAAPSHSTYPILIMAEDASSIPGVDGSGPFPGMIHCRVWNLGATLIPAATAVNFVAYVGGVR